MTHLVSVYLVNRRYGGDEEGGWWYTHGQLTRTVKIFRNKEKAYEYAERLNEKLESRKVGPNVGRRAISSVLSNGEYSARVSEDHAPKQFPEETPHYC